MEVVIKEELIVKEEDTNEVQGSNTAVLAISPATVPGSSAPSALLPEMLSFKVQARRG